MQNFVHDVFKMFKDYDRNIEEEISFHFSRKRKISSKIDDIVSNTNRVKRFDYVCLRIRLDFFIVQSKIIMFKKRFNSFSPFEEENIFLSHELVEP